jgi:hypothetical protein
VTPFWSVDDLGLTKPQHFIVEVIAIVQLSQDPSLMEGKMLH